MRIVTIGGATQDIYLMHHGSNFMSLTQQDVTVDYTLLRSGSKIEVDHLKYFTGGGATNTAASFKTMGFEVTCFCNVGKDPQADFILQELKDRNIDTSCITQTADACSGTSFIIKSGDKDRTIFAFRGANAFVQKDKIPYDCIKESNHLYITSLSNDAAQLLPDIVSFARKNNIPVAINPGMSQLAGGVKILRQALPNIDIFILNYEEAKAFMLSLAEYDATFKEAFSFSPSTRSCPIDIVEAPQLHLDEQPYLIDNPIACEGLSFSIRQFFKQMLILGPKIIVVTNGSNGVYVAAKDEIYFHPSIKTKVVDTVGAGDSFGSSFVGSLLYKDSISDALRNGIINSASVLGEVGPKNGHLSHKELSSRRAALDENLINRFTL